MFKIFISLLLLINIGLFADDTKKFSQEQLDTMVAPIALYPDALLSQIFMATTFNEQLKEAIKYSKSNPKENGDEAVKKVQNKGWDASVSSLVAFPQVLSMLGKKPSWSKDLGDAFLAQPEKIMDTVQSLRNKAMDAGNLKTTKEQKVEVEDADTTKIIIVEPTTETVYVPVYNPAYVYGTWWYAYPPYYYYPPYYKAPPYGIMIGFGVGIAITYSLWGGFGWHNHSTYININHYNKININKISGSGNRVNWKNKNIKNKPSVKDRQRDNAKKAMGNKGFDLDKGRKQLSGTKGDSVRKNLNSGKFKSASNSSAFSGVNKPERSHKEASRGSFSRNSGSRDFSSHGNFSRGGSGISHRSGGFRGRR